MKERDEWDNKTPTIPQDIIGVTNRGEGISDKTEEILKTLNQVKYS